MASHIRPFTTRQHMIDTHYEIHHSRDTDLNAVALHHHDFYEIYFFLSGQVTYAIESRNYRLRPRDILLISPTELHQPLISTDDPYERIVLWVEKSFVDSLRTQATDLSRCFDVQSPAHTNLLRPDPLLGQWVAQRMEMLLEASESTQFGSDVLGDAIVAALLVRLNREAIARPVRYELFDKSAPIIENALQYINDHFDGEITLDALAASCFVSKYHLSREFRRIVGTSVYRYVIQKRLLMARQMILSGCSPTDVYGQCGFGDYANFYRAFKLEYGLSPSEFVRLSRGAPGLSG